MGRELDRRPAARGAVPLTPERESQLEAAAEEVSAGCPATKFGMGHAARSDGAFVTGIVPSFDAP